MAVNLIEGNWVSKVIKLINLMMIHKIRVYCVFYVIFPSKVLVELYNFESKNDILTWKM